MGTESAASSNISTAASLATLITALTGGGNKTATNSGGTTTQTSTKQTTIDAAGLQSLIQSMLENESTGLAKVASGSKQAGLYNSSANTLLVNDLISRASNAAALASAPTTETQTTTTPTTTSVTSSEGLLSNATTLLPLLGAGLLMKKDSSGKSMFDTLAESVGGYFGGSGQSSAYDLVAGGISEDTMGSNAISSLLDNYSQTSNVEANALTSIVPEIDASTVSDVGSSVLDYLSSAGDSVVSGAKDLWDTLFSW